VSDDLSISRDIARARAALLASELDANGAPGAPEQGTTKPLLRNMDEVIQNLPVHHPRLFIPGTKTVVFGDWAHMAPPSPATAPPPAPARPVDARAIESEIEARRAQLGDLAPSDPRRATVQELLGLLQGVDAIARSGMRVDGQTLDRIDHLRSAAPLLKLREYTDGELRTAIARTQIERDKLPAGDGRRADLDGRLRHLLGEGDRRWGEGRPCDDARPTLLPASQLPSVAYSAAELTSCATGKPCATVEQATAIEVKRQETCAWTGVDPWRFEDVAHGTAVADVDLEAPARAEAQRRAMWLQAIGSQAQNPMAAGAVIGSVALGASLETTVAWAEISDASAGAIAAMAGATWRAPTELPAMRGMRRPSPGPGLGPGARAGVDASKPPLTRAPAASAPVWQERTGPAPGSRPAAGADVTLPRDPAERARFAASQLTPSGKHWTDPSLTFPELVEHYRARVPNGGLSVEQLREEFDAGKRLDPESKRMVAVEGTAVYGTAPETPRLPASSATAVTIEGRNVSASTLHRRLNTSEQTWEMKDAKLKRLEANGAPKEVIDAARNEVAIASRELGEAGADVYVAARYPGPPPPKQLWPVGDAVGRSRSGDFDRIYRVADEYGHTRIIVEAKGNSADLQDRAVTDDVRRSDQGTRQYLEKVIDLMANNPSDPSMRDVGEQLQEAYKKEQIDYIEVRAYAGTPPKVQGREFSLDIDTGTRPPRPRSPR
jgi:hypothetical protein